MFDLPFSIPVMTAPSHDLERPTGPAAAPSRSSCASEPLGTGEGHCLSAAQALRPHSLSSRPLQTIQGGARVFSQVECWSTVIYSRLVGEFWCLNSERRLPVWSNPNLATQVLRRSISAQSGLRAPYVASRLTCGFTSNRYGASGDTCMPPHNSHLLLLLICPAAHCTCEDWRNCPHLPRDKLP